MPGFLAPLVPWFGLGSPVARAGFTAVAVPWLGAAALAAPRHRLLLLGVR